MCNLYASIELTCIYILSYIARFSISLVIYSDMYKIHKDSQRINCMIRKKTKTPRIDITDKLRVEFPEKAV